MSFPLPQVGGRAFEHGYSMLENSCAIGILQRDCRILLGEKDREPFFTIESL